MSARISCTIAALLLLVALSGCGVVRYREVSFTVRDESSNAPIPNARVSVQVVQEMLVWNSGRVPAIQDGSTDEVGVWKATVPTNQMLGFYAESDGYEKKIVSVQPDTLHDGKLEVKLTPAARQELDKPRRATSPTEE